MSCCWISNVCVMWGFKRSLTHYSWSLIFVLCISIACNPIYSWKTNKTYFLSSKHCDFNNEGSMWTDNVCVYVRMHKGRSWNRACLGNVTMCYGLNLEHREIFRYQGFATDTSLPSFFKYVFIWKAEKQRETDTKRNTDHPLVYSLCGAKAWSGPS